MRHTIMHVTDPATGKVYPVPAGGSEDEPPVEDPEPTEEVEPDPDALGDAGKKALDQERQARKAAEKKAKRADELEAELEQLREQQMSEQEKAIKEARKEAAEEAREEVLSEVRRDLLETRIVRAATGRLTNPELATRLIDLDDLDPDDSEAISEAIEGLLKQEPYLAASATQPVGDGGGGPRKNDEEPDPSEMDPGDYIEWRRKRRAS